MPQDEAFSWKKLAKGPLVGKNYAKAIVLTLCQAIIIALIGGVIFTVWTLRGKPSEKSETTVGTNAGTLSQSDSHDSTVVNHYHLPLSDMLKELFSFGSKGKVIDNKKGEKQ